MSGLVCQEVIHKVRTVRFLNFRPPSPCTCTYTFSLHRMWFVRENVSERDKFCELLSIKEPQTTLQNREATVQSCRKMLNKNAKKSPEIEGAIFERTGEMEMDNFGHLNSSLYLFCFFLVTNLRKKNYHVRTLTVEPSPHPYEPVRF